MTPVWIAHRGYPTHYPENTLVGYQASIAAGALWLETDIQLSSDLVPMLYHDETLDRISQTSGFVFDRTAEELQSLPASHASCFGNKFDSERIATLASLVERLLRAPEVQIMIELKGESLDRFGIPTMVSRVMECVQPIMDQCVMISFDLDSLIHARHHSGARIGWVLPEWSDAIRQRAESERPEYLVVDRELIPATPKEPWTGSWQWAVYSIDEERGVQPMLDRGIQMLETNCIGEMIHVKR